VETWRLRAKKLVELKNNLAKSFFREVHFCCSKQFVSISEVIARLKTLTQKSEVIGGNFRKFLELKDFYTI